MGGLEGKVGKLLGSGGLLVLDSSPVPPLLDAESLGVTGKLLSAT